MFAIGGSWHPLEKTCQSRHAVLASLKGLYDCMTAHDQPALWEGTRAYEEEAPGIQVQLSSV